MRGVSCSNRTSFLEPVFVTFLNNIDRYYDKTNGGDIPYHYNERATLSLFSAACWQTGSVALDEYVSRKNTKSGSGRTDIWIMPESNQFEIIAEVKQSFILQNELHIIPKAIDNAELDARKNPGNYMKCGLTFFTPSLTIECTRNDQIDFAKKIHDAALIKGVDVLAWWLPEKVLDFTDHRRKNGEKAKWPILIAALRVAKIGDSDIADGCPERLQKTSWGSNPLPL